MTETMPQAQINAGKELVAYLKNKYGISKVQAHRDVCSTSCPGKNFPFNQIAGAAAASVPVNSTTATSSAAKPATPSEMTGYADCRKNAMLRGFPSRLLMAFQGRILPAGCPDLQKRSKRNITRLIQERLNSLGFNCGKVDGIFGAGTENAVKTLQKVHGRTIDGIVGQNTWRILLGM